MSCFLLMVDRPLTPAFLARRRSSGTFKLAKELTAPLRWLALLRDVLALPFATRADSLADPPRFRSRFYSALFFEPVLALALTPVPDFFFTIFTSTSHTALIAAALPLVRPTSTST